MRSNDNLKDARARRRTLCVNRRLGLLCVCVAVTIFFGVRSLAHAKDVEPVVMSLAGGRLKLVAPAKWEKKEPAVRIIEYEFKSPKSKNGEGEARITIMGAGGSIDANIQRWKSQFVGPAETKISKSETSGCTVHLVDVTGTFKDRRKAVPRKDTRMLGAIIVTKKRGQYFIKMIGPKETVTEQLADFQKMLSGLKFE